MMTSSYGGNMNEKNILRSFAAIALFFFSTAVLSCAETNAALVFEKNSYTIEPGLTSELVCNVVFSETGDDNDGILIKPDRSSHKTFAEVPVINILNPEVKLLSVNPNLNRNSINTEIIVRASDTLYSGSTVDIEIKWAGYSATALLKVRKNPSAYINTDGVITDPVAYDALINKQRRLPADYIPPDLVRVDVPTILVFEEVNHLRRAASDALTLMVDAAEAEKAYELLARSGYRSYNTQVMLYDANVREHGEEYASRFSARPGTSEHQSGLVMDISSPVVNYQLTQDFGSTDEGIWIAENAHRFGFIIRYLKGKEDITGYAYEPWHLRYVGTDLASEIYNRGLTLEEYFTE